MINTVQISYQQNEGIQEKALCLLLISTFIYLFEREKIHLWITPQTPPFPATDQGKGSEIQSVFTKRVAGSQILESLLPSPKTYVRKKRVERDRAGCPAQAL